MDRKGVRELCRAWAVQFWGDWGEEERKRFRREHPEHLIVRTEAVIGELEVGMKTEGIGIYMRLVSEDAGETLVEWVAECSVHDRVAEAEKALGGKIPPGRWRFERQMMVRKWVHGGLSYVVVEWAGG